MKKENFFGDNPDIAFHLKNRVDFDAIFEWLSDEEKEMMSATNSKDYLSGWVEMLEVYGEFCGSQLAVNAEQAEKEEVKLVDGKVIIGPTMQANMDGMRELGMPGLSIETEFGGMAAPFLIEMVGCELGNRACPSTILNSGWWGPIAHIIEKFGSEELKEKFIPRIASGEISGNMALTEPDAGSDLSNIRTYAEKQEDGTYLLHGTKRFISNGNSEISLVLAMSHKGGNSLSDLSLFVAPSTIDGKQNIEVTKVEEKIGLHASATCELIYENSVGYLLGKEGDGFRYMLNLMNDSRIAVAFQGLGLMEGSLRLIQEYASQRKTWGKPIEQHELVADKLLDLEVETKAFRSLCYQAAYNRSLVNIGERYLKRHPDLPKAEKKEVEKKIAKYNRRVRRWTPLLKYWAGEKSFEHARTGLQLHGGYGFTKEYRAEWWVRESLIYALYEGTSQIQALMCTKDTLKDVVRKPSEFVETALGLSMKSFSESDNIRKQLYKLKKQSHSGVMAVILKMVKANVRGTLTETSGKDLVKVVKALSRDLINFKNLRPAFLNAERITEMQALVAIAESCVWDYEADPSRAWIAERFMHKASSRMVYLKSLIDNDDRVLLDRLDGFEEAEDVLKNTAPGSGEVESPQASA